jgi:hypothetical protein
MEYEMDGQHHAAVLETVTPSPFEHMADRAQILLLSSFVRYSTTRDSIACV